MCELPRCAALSWCVATSLLLTSCAPLWSSRQQTLKVSLPGQPDPQAEAVAEELLRDAEHLLDHDKPEKARLKLEAALRLNPGLGPAYNNLGLIYFSRRQLYEAACAFNNAIPLMPDSGVPHNNLGLTLEAGGRTEEAVAEFEQAFALDPHNPEFLGNLLRSRIAGGDVGDETVALLQELLFIETRPAWVAWAEEELAIHVPKAQLAGAVVPVPNGSVKGLTLPEDGPSVPTPALPDAPAEQPLVPPLPDAPAELLRIQ